MANKETKACGVFPAPEVRCSEFPTCPHCGHVHKDADPSEWHNDTVQDCEACEKTFNCAADYAVTYTTSPVQEIVNEPVQD